MKKIGTINNSSKENPHSSLKPHPSEWPSDGLPKSRDKELRSTQRWKAHEPPPTSHSMSSTTCFSPFPSPTNWLPLPPILPSWWLEHPSSLFSHVSVLLVLCFPSLPVSRMIPITSLNLQSFLCDNHFSNHLDFAMSKFQQIVLVII